MRPTRSTPATVAAAIRPGAFLLAFVLALLLAPGLGRPARAAEPEVVRPESVGDSGFVRRYWYEKGIEHANPFFNRRQLRVNAPETSVHPTFSKRDEARSSGLARILVEEDLLAVRSVSLYCELWGGHPGTAEKRVQVNGRSLYAFPEVGTARGHCTHQYPEIALRITDLVNGYNALQFACDRGEAFWGHYIVDNACIEIGLPPGHPDLDAAGLSAFAARVEATAAPGEETVRLRLAGAPEDLARVSAVHYQGRYLGYDENGDTRTSGWHGMTKGRRPYGMLGGSSTAPFEVAWDTSFVPAEQDVAVRALVELRDHANLLYKTPVLDGLEIAERGAVRVSWHHARDLPEPFWSRAGRKLECTIELDIDPASIEAAELHVVTWTGGAGNVAEYFTLNGRHFPVAEGSAHEVNYSRSEVEPVLLRRGSNRIELLSDTTHHGIEVLRPGPALAIRARAESRAE